MRRSIVVSMVCATLCGAAPAFAQVHVEVVAPAPPAPRVFVPAPPAPRVFVPAPPVVRFAAPPPLVMVAPGVRVVRDCDDEIFFSGGWYWHPGPDGMWYRTRSYRGGWVVAPRRVVPPAVARLPRGQYRHFRGEAWRDQRREERHDARMMRHEERHDARMMRHEEGRQEKPERRWDHPHGRRG